MTFHRRPVSVYYLHMTHQEQVRRAGIPAQKPDLVRATIPCPELNRFLFAAGGGDWYWHSRLDWSYRRWLQYLEQPSVETWVSYLGGTPVGYFELERQSNGNVEIVFFGLLPAFTGRGLGGHMLTVAVEQAWRDSTQRVWLHTCSLDHPHALGNYLSRGFTIYRKKQIYEELSSFPVGPWPGASREFKTHPRICDNPAKSSLPTNDRSDHMPDIGSWILTDTTRHIWSEELTVVPRDLGMRAPNGAAIHKKTLRGGLSDGVDLIEIDNGALSLSVIPTRGMGIWRGAYRSLDLGWKSPVRGPVHPNFVDQHDRGGLGWLTGFDELMVRCGLDSNGPPATDIVPNNAGTPTETTLTLHGKIANIPASRVEIRVMPSDPPELMVIGQLWETGLFYPGLSLRTTLSTRCNSNKVTILDEVTNLGGVEAEMELLYHCNFGPPFLEAGARLETPASLVAPRDSRAAENISSFNEYMAPTPGYVEQVYWFKPLADEAGHSLAMLRNSTADRGVVLRFDTDQLPCFTQWKNTAAVSDGYVTGLEPGTDYPNSRAFERQQGRVVKLDPGETYHACITMEFYDGSEGIESIQREIATIQEQAPLEIHKQPLPELSASPQT